jgi:hypothetical protein
LLGGVTAELSASELVTNAYRHTKGPAALRLRGLDELGGETRSGLWFELDARPAADTKAAA